MTLARDREDRTPDQGTLPAWRKDLADAITDPDQLISLLGLPDAWREPARQAAGLFPLKVPRGYLRLIEAGNPEDPLLRQVLPVGEEFDQRADYLPDPLGESAVQPLPGLLRKYANRVLLIASGACAIHCRYCFRRNFPYAEYGLHNSQWSKIIDYLRGSAELDEVILSGGDPLMLSDRKLGAMVSDLERIAHLKTLRIHSRLPVFLPNRISDALLDTLSGGRLRTVLVLHINHPNEIGAELALASRELGARRVTLLNQAVLLRRVNDSAQIQIHLSKALFAAGILPYYLHLPDRVRGTSHFAVDDLDPLRMMEELRASLPGYLVPRLVREIPGQPAKTVIG